ncbi:MAG: DUF1080 domain-containing protein [Pirellulaceae bacterium]
MQAGRLFTAVSIVVLGVICCTSLFAQDATSDTAESTNPKTKKSNPEWTSLFNGEDLSGWTPKIRYHELGENFGNTFRVEDGLIKVRYDAYEKFEERFGHLFYETEYSNYDFRVEYRFVGEQCPGGPGWALRNSGVMIHGQPPKTMTVDQDFPVSIEVQLLGGDGSNPRHNANLCTPGTHVVIDNELYTRHCIDSKSKTYHGEDWVTVTIEVRGNEVIRHLIDGEVVLEYTKPQLDPGDKNTKHLLESRDGLQLHGGSISLQSESHPIDFRKVEIRVYEEE